MSLKRSASCWSSRSNLPLERDCEEECYLTLIITYRVCSTLRAGRISRAGVGVPWGLTIRWRLFLPEPRQERGREAQVRRFVGRGSGQESSL